MMPARLMATKVLPSPLMVLVMAIDLRPGGVVDELQVRAHAAEALRDQALGVLVHEQLADGDLLLVLGHHAQDADAGIAELGDVVQRGDVVVQDVPHQHDQEADDDPGEQVGEQHHVAVGGDGRRSAAWRAPGCGCPGTKPALLIRYSMSFSSSRV